MGIIKKTIITITQIILVGVIIFSGVKVFGYWQNLQQTDKIEEESRNLIEIVNEDIAEANENISKDVQKNVEEISLNFIEELKKSYPEAVGHIEIDDTRISYPIVQHKDNKYYLNHAPDRSENANGSLFLDFRNSPNLIDDNNIIYGHYIRSGKLFHNLYKFREQEFFEKVDKIELQTLDGPKSYKVFSVYDTDPSFQYRYINYDNWDEKLEFINKIKEKSLINAGVIDELENEDSRILTLSTCSNKGSTRLVVHCVEIDSK